MEQWPRFCGIMETRTPFLVWFYTTIRDLEILLHGSLYEMLLAKTSEPTTAAVDVRTTIADRTEGFVAPVLHDDSLSPTPVGIVWYTI